MAKVKLDFLTKITKVHFDSGFLLSVQAFTASEVNILDNVTATFQDHDISRVINSTENIPSHGVPPNSQVRIVDPPTDEVKNAYQKWRTATDVEIQNPGESSSTYTATSTAYFHFTGDVLVEQVVVTGLGPAGVTNVLAVFAQLFDPKGNVIASEGNGSANCPNECTFTVTANSKLGTVTATRFPDP